MEGAAAAQNVQPIAITNRRPLQLPDFRASWIFLHDAHSARAAIAMRRRSHSIYAIQEQLLQKTWRALWVSKQQSRSAFPIR